MDALNIYIYIYIYIYMMEVKNSSCLCTHELFFIIACFKCVVVVLQRGEGSAGGRRRPEHGRQLQQRVRHVAGERRPLTGG